MADLFAGAPISRDEKIGQLRREIKMRKSVYPRWVAAGKMKQEEADRGIMVFERILQDYEEGSVS